MARTRKLMLVLLIVLNVSACASIRDPEATLRAALLLDEPLGSNWDDVARNLEKKYKNVFVESSYYNKRGCDSAAHRGAKAIEVEAGDYWILYDSWYPMRVDVAYYFVFNDANKLVDAVVCKTAEGP